MDNSNLERYYSWNQLVTDPPSPSIGSSSISDTSSYYGSSPNSFSQMPLMEEYYPTQANAYLQPPSPQYASYTPSHYNLPSPQTVQHLLYSLRNNRTAHDALLEMQRTQQFKDDNLLNDMLVKRGSRYCCIFPECEGHQKGWSRPDRAREHFRIEHLQLGLFVCPLDHWWVYHYNK